MALFYGALGLGYLLILLLIGRTPAALLPTMNISAGAAFAALFIVWLNAMRRGKSRAHS
jgi:hypothetical protein